MAMERASDTLHIGHEIIEKTTEKTVQVKERFKAAYDRQKSYADERRKPLQFQEGDKVMLNVSPWKGMICFGKMGKINPRYIGIFEILNRIVPMAYRLKLPQDLFNIQQASLRQRIGRNHGPAG